MPEVQEVFRMATQKIRPEPGFVDRQLAQQRRRARNRRNGAFALVVVLGVAAAVFMIRLAGGEDRSQPAVRPSPPPPEVVPDGPYTIDLDTGEATPLDLPDAYGYAVSPDGAKLAYNSGGDPGTRGRVYVADADGTNVREITTPGVGDALGPAWSPDGSLLVFQGHDFGRQIGNLFVVEVATGQVRQVTDLGEGTAEWWFLSPVFSPDGETILFQMARGSDLDTRWDLWSVPVAGGEPTIVRHDASFGVYSPNGQTIAYLDAPRDGRTSGWTSSLWIADADGGNPRLLVDGEFDFVRWSPDGTRIAYSGDGQVHVVDVATGAVTTVADGGTGNWVDDDTLLIGPLDLV
jgi:Tol biopolymer transport system component